MCVACEYNVQLEKLHLRIGDKGRLVAEMKKLKPCLFINELRALNNLSNKEMKRYLKLRKQKKKLEKEYFLKMFPPEIRSCLEEKYFS